MCTLFLSCHVGCLGKKSGVVHQIAVGCTLQMLVVKVAGFLVVAEMTQLLSPVQIGYDWCSPQAVVLKLLSMLLKSSSRIRLLSMP